MHIVYRYCILLYYIFRCLAGDYDKKKEEEEIKNVKEYCVGPQQN